MFGKSRNRFWSPAPRSNNNNNNKSVGIPGKFFKPPPGKAVAAPLSTASEWGTEGRRLDAKFSLVLFVRSFVRSLARCVRCGSVPVRRSGSGGGGGSSNCRNTAFLSPMTRVFLRSRYALRRPRPRATRCHGRPHIVLDKYLTMGKTFENMASCPARVWDSRNLSVYSLSHRV